jgi:hypothetical protein
MPAPQRLADQAGTAVGVALRAASRFEPPSGAQDRVWRRLRQPNARLIEQDGEDPVLVAVLHEAADTETPPGVRERIWGRIAEQHAVQVNAAEPRRLMDTHDAVAGLLAAASVDPSAGHEARVFRRLKEPRRQPVRWGLPFGVLTAATAALMLVFHLQTPVVSTGPSMSLALSLPSISDAQVVHLDGSSNLALAVGDSVVVGASGEARFQVRGVGDVILGEPGSSLKLLQANDRGVHLELAQGRVSVHADKRTRSAPLVIHSQGAEVEVVGTIFSVEATSTGPRVYVREGLVEVRSAGRVARVGLGQSWPAVDLVMPAWASDSMSTLDKHPRVIGALSSTKTVVWISPIGGQKQHGEGKTRRQSGSLRGRGPWYFPLPSASAAEIHR